MATVEEVGTMGLSNVAEQNLVFGLLVTFIIFGTGTAVWIIKTLTSELRDARIKHTDDMDKVRLQYSQDSKDVLKVLTEVATTLRLAVNK